MELKTELLLLEKILIDHLLSVAEGRRGIQERFVTHIELRCSVRDCHLLSSFVVLGTIDAMVLFTVISDGLMYWDLSSANHASLDGFTSFLHNCLDVASRFVILMHPELFLKILLDGLLDDLRC